VRVKTTTPTWSILAVLTYEVGLDELLGRQVAVTGVPAHAAVEDWSVTWTDGMRVLDGRGRTVLVPGEGVLIASRLGGPSGGLTATGSAERSRDEVQSPSPTATM